MTLEEARLLAQRIILNDYAETWLQPQAVLHDALAALIHDAVATATAHLTTQATAAAAEAHAAEQLIDHLHRLPPGIELTPAEQRDSDHLWDAYEAACAAHDAVQHGNSVASVLPRSASQGNL